MVVSQFVNLCLHFPEEYLEDEGITEVELEKARIYLLNILNKKISIKISEKNEHFGQLIKVLALANRHQRCRKSLDFLLNSYKNNIHPNWKPSYNLIFMGTTLKNGILGAVTHPKDLKAILYRIPRENPWEVVSQIKYGRHYFNLNHNEKIKCDNINILVKVIYAQTKILTVFFKEHPKMLSFQDLFNFLEKFNYLFKELFSVNVTDIEYGGILEPYRIVRNSLAHHHMIFGNNGPPILVQWEYQRNQPKRVLGTLTFNVDDLIVEISILCVIISQIMGLYQLASQIL